MTTTAQPTPLAEQPAQAIREQLSQWRDQYNGLDGGNLKLDLSRGKPGIEQVSLSDSLDGIYRAITSPLTVRIRATTVALEVSMKHANSALRSWVFRSSMR